MAIDTPSVAYLDDGNDQLVIGHRIDNPIDTLTDSITLLTQ